MTALAAQLPPAIDRYLRRYRRRRLWQRVVRRAGLALLLTLFWAASWCIVDRIIALPAHFRLAILIINLAAVIAIIGRGLMRFLERPSWIHVSREIERRQPRWNERLATVTSRTFGPANLVGSTELLDVLSDEVSTEARQHDPRKLLPWSPIARPFISCAILAIALCIIAMIFPAIDLPRLIHRYAMPLANVAPAATTRLLVAPGDVKIPAGEALRVRATAERLEEGTLTLHTRIAADNPDAWIDQPMFATTDGAFEARVSSLERDLDYYVTGGDARSDVFHATVLRRPAIVAFHYTIHPPPYLRLPQRTITNDDGTIEAPIGSDVEVQIESSEPLATATIDFGGDSIATKPTQQTNIRQGRLVVRDNRTINVQMTSAAGVEGQFTGAQLRAISDRPPIVKLALADDSTKNADTIRYRAADDFGLARVDLEIATANGTQHVINLPTHGDDRDQSGNFTIDPNSIGAHEGDEITIRLRGEDRGGQFALSDQVTLTIAAPSNPSPPPTANDQPTTEPATSPEFPIFNDAISAYFRAIAGSNK